MYSVYQHWDPLKVCIVGKSYSPEFYSFIRNERVRTVMERIAQETEEDYQKLINVLEKFNVKVLRPTVTDNHLEYVDPTIGKIVPPPMTPRDYSLMLGNDFYWRIEDAWRSNSPFMQIQNKFWGEILNHVADQNNNIISKPPDPVISGGIGGACAIRIGRDLYVGTLPDFTESMTEEYEVALKKWFVPKNYRIKIVDTRGHSDGVLCAVKPGLIVSLKDITNYKDTFPNWEVIYLPYQSWERVDGFLSLKKKNHGKWWVPGEELNDDFTKYVNQWLSHWVGYVEETVFDVNMLVIDKQNVVCTNYNKEVFDAFDRHGVTPHIVNFRHRYFWDGGLHCITSDLDREGAMEDYFPERK